MIFPFYSGYGLYILFSLPALLLGLWAQLKVKSAYSRYSKVKNFMGLTGAEVARRMLNSSGLYNVPVEETNGYLSDYYDSSKKVLRLSSDTFRGNSIAAAGVAAHEAGHALQDQAGYAPLRVRAFMVPSVQIGSWLGPIIFFVGLLLSSSFGTNLAWGGLILFGLTALFSVVTLPVELDASNRAKAWLANSGVIYQQETAGVKSVLDAAALTYVAAAIQAISIVMYYAFILLGRPRRN